MQYFDNYKSTENEKKIIEINFNNKKYKIKSNNGIFSKEKIDYGTRLLLNTIINKDLKGKALDLGCGYGIIGLILGTEYPNLKIDMVDITDRAVELSKENTKKLNNINVFKSNIYENVLEKYDYIITNPPIRAGKEIIKKFLIEAKDHINKDGKLYFVMRKNHGVKTIIKILEDYYNIEIEQKDKGFYIVKCTIK